MQEVIPAGVSAFQKPNPALNRSGVALDVNSNNGSFYKELYHILRPGGLGINHICIK